jgi:hypothetical protein
MNLVERAQKILLQPNQEWPVIEREPTTTAELYTGYIMPLAAIGPVASIIGNSIVGHNYFGVNFKVPIANALVIAVVSYVLSLGSVYVVALITDNLAPTFNAQRDMNQALKLVAYSFTPAYIGGIFNLLPALAILALLLSLYGLYLLYLGVPVMMKAPPEKAGAYTGVIILITFVVFLVIYAIIGAVFNSFYGVYGPSTSIDVG